MRARAVLVAVIMAAGAIVATAPSASALPTCQGMSVWFDGFDQYERPTTANNTRNTNCVLGVGSQGMAVNYLQVALNVCYGQGLAGDGIFGPRTRQAVINVQRFHGIRADGVFGPQTSAVMFWPYYHYENRCHMP